MNITFISDRCLRSLAVATHAKYEYDLTDQTYQYFCKNWNFPNEEIDEWSQVKPQSFNGKIVAYKGTKAFFFPWR